MPHPAAFAVAALLLAAPPSSAQEVQERLEDFFPSKSRTLPREHRAQLRGLLDRFVLKSPFDRAGARARFRDFGAAALPILEAAATSRNEGKALGAVLCLDDLPGEEVDRLLIRVLLDPGAQEPVRIGAVLVAGWRGGKDLVQALERAWAGRRTRGITIAMGFAFARLGAGGALLARELREEGGDQVLGAAALGAGLPGHAGAFGRIAALLGRGEEQIRAPAALALGTYAGDRVRDLLLPLLRDPDEQVRAAAALSVGGFEGREVTEALVGLLEDSEEAPRAAATGALSWRRDQRLPDLLIDRLTHDRSDLVRLRAAAGLWSHSSPAATRILERALLDRSARVRTRAVLSLAAGEREVGPGVLERGLSDPDPEVADAAVLALALRAPATAARSGGPTQGRTLGQGRGGPHARLVDAVRRGRISATAIPEAFSRALGEAARAALRARAAETLFHRYLGLEGQLQLPTRRLFEVPVGQNPYPVLVESRFASELGTCREDLKVWLEGRPFLPDR